MRQVSLGELHMYSFNRLNERLELPWLELGEIKFLLAVTINAATMVVDDLIYAGLEQVGQLGDQERFAVEPEVTLAHQLHRLDANIGLSTDFERLLEHIALYLES